MTALQSEHPLSPAAPEAIAPTVITEASANALSGFVQGTSCEALEADQNVAQDGTPKVAESFAKVCAMLGMSAQAPYGWGKIHVKPHVGCLMYCCSVSTAIATVAVLFVAAVPWGILIMNVPALIAVVSYAFCASWIWRFGPAASAEPVYLAASAMLTLSLTFMVVAVFTGPLRYSPFGNRLKFIISDAVAIFATMLSGLNGGIAADHPPQPYTTIWTSVKNAAFSTMRLVDGLTDIGFVRILLEQGPDCMWYGNEVPCMHYTRLAIITGIISVGNLLLMASLLQMTGQVSLFESAGSRFKVVLAVNTVIMLCEIGGITIVLLKVFSDMQLDGGHDSERLHREAAFALASCFTTVCCFGINVLGMRKLLAVLRATSHRLRGRLASSQRSSYVSPIGPQQSA